MELQHVNVKIYSSTPDAVNLDEAILVFHRWIRDDVAEELLIDVADYSHVPAGPGVLLIGHQAAYSLEDGEEERAGLLYNAKTKREGSNVDRIVHALRQAVKACVTLEGESLWSQSVKFNAGDLAVIINDRALAPNTPETFAAIKDELTTALQQVFGNTGFSLSYEQGDPRRRFQVNVKSESAVAPGDLAAAAK
ncbi:MAG: hypothetical protein NXI24_21330 [bacterium]|nr:hypothetical protein [bacterium]